MRCGFYDTFMTYVITRDENAHRFTISNAYKDLRYLGAMADAAGVVDPLGSAVKNQFAAMAAAGEAERYVPMLADFVASTNGIRLFERATDANPNSTTNRHELGAFILRAIAGEDVSDEWQRTMVAHYHDEEMETARRECVRLLGHENYGDHTRLSEAALQYLRSMAEALKA
jgi:hypothetical protein